MRVPVHSILWCWRVSCLVVCLNPFYCTCVLCEASEEFFVCCFFPSRSSLSGHDEIRRPFFPDELNNRRAGLLLEFQQLWLNIPLQVPVRLLGCQSENVLYPTKNIPKEVSVQHWLVFIVQRSHTGGAGGGLTYNILGSVLFLLLNRFLDNAFHLLLDRVANVLMCCDLGVVGLQLFVQRSVVAEREAIYPWNIMKRK